MYWPLVGGCLSHVMNNPFHVVKSRRGKRRSRKNRPVSCASWKGTPIPISVLAAPVEDAHRGVPVGVDTLHVPVEHGLQIVQIAPLSTRRPLVVISLGKARVPAIVETHREREVAAIAVDAAGKVLGTDGDVGFRVEARVVLDGALVGRDLHQPVFAIGTARARLAAGLLGGNRGEEDSRDADLARDLVEDVDVLRTGGEHLTGTSCAPQVGVNHVAGVDRWWDPTAAGNAAGEPF